MSGFARFAQCAPANGILVSGRDEGRVYAFQSCADCETGSLSISTGNGFGRFYQRLVAYSGENGVQELLDGVYPGIVFEIAEPPETTHHVEWSHQYWGHIRLRDMRLTLE